MTFSVYILGCSDGSYYVGFCSDLANRVKQHQEGLGAKHTRDRLPVRLLYSEEHPTELEAVRRERQLKRWSHGKKTALIEGNIAELQRLAKRRKR